MFYSFSIEVFYLLRLIYRYLILGGVFLKGTLFLYFFSNISLLVNRNATDFWMFILCLATLLNSLISLSSFCVESLGFSIYIVSFHLHKVIILCLLFQFGYLWFILFVWLLWLGLPILCWIKVVRVGNLVLFQVFAGRLSGPLLCVFCWLWV